MEWPIRSLHRTARRRLREFRPPVPVVNPCEGRECAPRVFVRRAVRRSRELGLKGRRLRDTRVGQTHASEDRVASTSAISPRRSGLCAVASAPRADASAASSSPCSYSCKTMVGSSTIRGVRTRGFPSADPCFFLRLAPWTPCLRKPVGVRGCEGGLVALESDHTGKANLRHVA